MTILVSKIFARHKIWTRIAPTGKMTSDQFVQFIVDNKIGTGNNLRSISNSCVTIVAGKDHDARNMFKMMDKDKNGVMEFEEFVLILLLPRSAEEISTEQFANCTFFQHHSLCSVYDYL